MIYQAEKLEFLALSRIDPLPEVYIMVNEERYAEAANYLDFFMEYEYVNQNPEVQKLYNSISKKRSSWKYKLGKIVCYIQQLIYPKILILILFFQFVDFHAVQYIA